MLAMASDNWGLFSPQRSAQIVQEQTRTTEQRAKTSWDTIFAKIEAADSPPTMLLWCGEGCPPCEKVKPMLKRLAAEGYDVQFGNTANPAHAELARDWKIELVPTLILHSEGNEICRWTGCGNMEQSQFRWIAVKLGVKQTALKASGLAYSTTPMYVTADGSYRLGNGSGIQCDGNCASCPYQGTGMCPQSSAVASGGTYYGGMPLQSSYPSQSYAMPSQSYGGYYGGGMMMSGGGCGNAACAMCYGGGCY